MENRFWFDSYDFVANERGFSPEELETVHRLLSEGKKVWMTPVRIEEDEQLKTLRISESRCCMLRMGSVKKKVYFTPADEKTFRYMVSVMNKEQKEYLRSHRCLVPGERKDYIVCPECNHCDSCPFGYCGETRESHFTSRDQMLESEYEPAVDHDSPEKVVLEHMVVQEVLDRVSRRNPKAGRALLLKEYYGYEVREIAGMMNETERNVYYFVSEGKRIAREEWKKEEP
jgi:hypothetical protein